MNSLAVFVKNPYEGNVKTRLSRTIGQEMARKFYLLCLECLREDLFWITNKSSLELIISPYCNEDIQWCKEFWGNYLVIPQPNGDLGERLNTIAETLFENGSEAVIITGSDAPTLPPAYMLQCIEGLSNSDAIMGPTRDGGFYTLGSRRPIPLLRGVNWSNSTTCNEVFQRLVNSGLSVTLGPPWYDIDVASDLYILAKDLRPTSEARYHMKILVDELLEHFSPL